jgi:hypothetical protein
VEPPSGGPINLVVTIKATSEKAAKDAVSGSGVQHRQRMLNRHAAG